MSHSRVCNSVPGEENTDRVAQLDERCAVDERLVAQSEKDTQGRAGCVWLYNLDQDSHPLGPNWEIEDDNRSDTPTEPASKRARDRFEGREPGSSASNSARGVAFSELAHWPA